MIPLLSNVGRTVLSQVGRQFGRQAMQRLMQGEMIEDVLSRDELRQLGKDLAKQVCRNFSDKAKMLF